jgi:hypothetical protein
MAADPKSQTKSQRPQTPGHARPLPAAIAAARWHVKLLPGPAGIGRPCLRSVVLPQLLGTLAVQTASRFRSPAAGAGVDVAGIDPAAEAFPAPLEVTAMASVFDDER